MIWKRVQKFMKRIEVVAELENTARMLTIGLGAAAIVCLLFLFLTIHLARKPIYVIRVDPDGRSFLVTDLKDGEFPTHQEARAMAEAFLRDYVGFDSSRPEEPLREALSVMTTRLFEQHREIYKGQDLPAHIRSLKIRTEFDIQDNRITEATEQGFTVRLSGRVQSYRLEEAAKKHPVLEKMFKAEIRLLRTKRTASLPSGLLVDAFSYNLLNEGETKS